MYVIFFFFFNDTATTEIYTLSLHDALPISPAPRGGPGGAAAPAVHARRARLLPRQAAGIRAHGGPLRRQGGGAEGDRKSTRLNSSHANISYAVFCLKKKKKYNMYPI